MTEIIINREKTRKDTKKNLQSYVCMWCSTSFQQYVVKFSGNGKRGISDQVQCPRCLNFLKTWQK